MGEDESYVVSRNEANRKVGNAGLGHIIIPDGGIMYTTTTNAPAEVYNGDSANLHLQHHHHVVNLRCGTKDPKQLNGEPINTLIGYFLYSI